ncbi:MAG: TonB-dependent receptor [Candidatus Neomarinimicrobiota bacterium]
MKRGTFQTLILLTLLVSTVYAQHGKISGSAIDRETREPLIGANVILVGTSLGAATDTEGEFMILNVSPGTYSLRATYVGYQQVTISNVKVVAGLTAFVEDIEMSPVALEGEPIQVVAERPLIEKSATNAVRILTSEDMENLPVRGAQDYFTLQPGVILQNERVHIRGSRSDEVGYLIEGASTKNIVSRDGGSLITTIPEALEEVLVQAGGYTAQFGGANAGIVQQNFRTGGQRLHTSFQMESDNFADAGEQFLNTYSYGYSDYVLTLSGPLFSRSVRFYLVGENYFIREHNPVFWSGSPQFWSDGAPVDTVYDSGLRGGTKGDMEVLNWDPGNVPGRFRNRYSVNGTLLFDLKQLQIRTAGAYTWQRRKGGEIGIYGITDYPVRNLFALERQPLNDYTEAFWNTKASYFITPKSFLELNLNIVDRRRETYDPFFGDDILAYGDSLRAAEHGWTYGGYSGLSQPYDFHGFPFQRPGYLLTGYTKDQRAYVGGSAALTAQMGRHELRAGGSTENWTVRNYFISGGRGGLPSLLGFLRLNPDSARVEDAMATMIRQQATPNIYGFDEFGNVLDKGDDGPRHPQFSSLYLQDKIEFSDLIINAGVRYDYIDMDAWALEDSTRPEYDLDEYTLLGIGKSKAHQFLSPRLGFSFPVTDRTVFHLQYGRFVQAPGLDVTYRGLAYSAYVLAAGYYFINPVGYDLKPERSTQYEVGFSHQFTDFAAFDLTAFYKDIKGQIQFDNILTATGWDISRYAAYVNQDFATTKGLEFSLRVRRINRVGAQVNYTLSDARGTNSFSRSAGGAIEGPGGEAPKIVVPQSYDQTHRGSMNVDYRFGPGDGGPILQRTGLNLLLTFNSGHRFTLAKSPGGLGQEDAAEGAILNDTDSRQRAPLEPINSSQTPWVFNLNVRIDKTVGIGGIDLNFYVYVQNLINKKNVINIYYATGNAFDDGFLSSVDGQQIVQSAGERFADLYQVINMENRQHNWRQNGFDLFGTPRQVRFGVSLEL